MLNPHIDEVLGCVVHARAGFTYRVSHQIVVVDLSEPGFTYRVVGEIFHDDQSNLH